MDSIEAAHDGLSTLVGGGAALAFAVALLASGLSSSSVGTYAGQRADLMGALVNRRATTVAASVVAAVIIALNVFLIGDTLLR